MINTIKIKHKAKVAWVFLSVRHIVQHLSISLMNTNFKIEKKNEMWNQYCLQCTLSHLLNRYVLKMEINSGWNKTNIEEMRLSKSAHVKNN